MYVRHVSGLESSAGPLTLKISFFTFASTGPVRAGFYCLCLKVLMRVDLFLFLFP